MLVNDVPRPTFLVRSVVRATGSPRCETAWLPTQAYQFLIPTGSTVEDLWAALEPLILALTLAGYEVPEIVVAAPGTTVITGYVTLSCQYGTVIYDTKDWKALTGAQPPARTWLAVALHVTVRRTLGRASQHPPIALQTISGYIAKPDPADPFADAKDGWLHLYSAAPGGTADYAVHQNTPVGATRDAVVAALATAWRGGAATGAVGLLRCLDPGAWTSALDRTVMVWPFDWLCTEVWTWLKQPDWMADFVGRSPGDRDASLGKIVERSGAETALEAWDPGRFKWRKPLKKARDALEARARLFHKKDANLPLVLARLEKTHYVLALFVLHEFGLIRILPFPLAHDQGIPLLDLTGWYETVAGQWEASGRPVIATLQLNQAGDRLVGWMYDGHLTRWDVSAELDITSYDPEQPDAFGSTFSFAATRKRQSVMTTGSIYQVPTLDRWTEDFKIWVAFGSTPYAMVRMNRNARVSPETILSALGSAAPPSLEAQTAPLHTLSQKGIGRAIQYLIQEIESATSSSAPSSWDTDLNVAFSRLKRMLADDGVLVFNGTTATPTPMLDRFRMEVARALLTTPIMAADGTDGWTHLLGMFAETGNDTIDLQNLIGARPNPHSYTFQMGGIGVAGGVAGGGKVEAGTFIIGCPIRHLTSCTPPGVDKASHGWSNFYEGRLVQGGVGLELGAEAKVTLATLGSPNDLATSSSWTPDDFVPSFFGSLELAGQVAAFYGGGITVAPPLPSNPTGAEGTQGEAYFFINRSGALGFGSSTGWAVSAGIGAGAGISGSVGATLGRLSKRWTSTQVQLPAPPAPTVLIASVNDEVKEGFPVNSDQLLPQTRALLLRFFAQYRALFESPTSFVTIEGDASPTGPEPYNESLSWRRALSVYAFLRSALTSPPSDQWSRETHALAVPDGRIKLVGNGETQSRLAGVPNDIESDDWRRVKILINDQVLVIA